MDEDARGRFTKEAVAFKGQYFPCRKVRSWASQLASGIPRRGGSDHVTLTLLATVRTQ